MSSILSTADSAASLLLKGAVAAGVIYVGYNIIQCKLQNPSGDLLSCTVSGVLTPVEDVFINKANCLTGAFDEKTVKSQVDKYGAAGAVFRAMGTAATLGTWCGTSY